MTRHPRHVEGYEGSLKQLAEAVGNMTYDEVARFTGEYADDIMRQADGDMERGNFQLASKLYSMAESLYISEAKMWRAWRICIPHMI